MIKHLLHALQAAAQLGIATEWSPSFNFYV